ncbi:MAG TPA: hypothetical protein VK742_19830, partial [Candidatus Sulfotelmatobacter sp.]|nr:hypothetical protein [Candidatus Sulfotelmatobacter sp.]
VSGAETAVVGHPPETTEIGKTGTMKTFILRRAKGVEEFWPGTGWSQRATRVLPSSKIADPNGGSIFLHA